MPLSTLEVHPPGLKVSASQSLQRPSLVFGTTSSVFADFLNQIVFVGLSHRLIRDLRVIVLRVTQCRSRNLFRKNFKLLVLLLSAKKIGDTSMKLSQIVKGSKGNIF